jgi:hypothetical protein
MKSLPPIRMLRDDLEDLGIANRDQLGETLIST